MPNLSVAIDIANKKTIRTLKVDAQKKGMKMLDPIDCQHWLDALVALKTFAICTKL